MRNEEKTRDRHGSVTNRPLVTPSLRGLKGLQGKKKGGVFPVCPGAFWKKRDSISRRAQTDDSLRRRVHEGEDKKEDQAAKEEEGIVPTKDPLRKLGVESNHQPFDLESNALPLAPPGLGHANIRQVSTKQQPFLFLFLQCTVYISSLEVQD